MNLLWKKLSVMLFLAFFLARIVFLTADSPLWLSWSTAPFTDEGSKAMHIRNFLLFGEKDMTKIQELCNDCNLQLPIIIDNPIVNAPLILFMNIFGINYFAIRMISVVFGLLSLLVFFFLIKEFFNEKTALLAVALLGFNFVFLMYNRIALLETPMTFFLIFSVFLWSRAFKQNSLLFSILSSLAFAFALLYKPITLAFVPAFLVMQFLLFKNNANKNLKNLLINLFLFILPILLFVFFTPNFSILGDVASYQGAQGLSDIARTAGIFFINRMFIQMPIFLLTAFIFAFYILIKFFEKKQFNALEIISIIWFFGMWAFFSLRAYQPPRYLIAVLPAMAVLSALFLTKLFELKRIEKISLPKNLLSKIIFVFFFLIFVFGVSLYLNKFFLSNNSLQQITSGTIVFFPIIAIIFLILIFVFNKFLLKRIGNFFYKNLAIILLFFILLNSFIPFFLWLSNPQYSLQNANAEIAKMNNPRIIGLWSESLCFESKFKCFAGADGTNLEYVFQQLKPTHILIGRDERDLQTIQKYNDYESIDVLKIKEFVVGGRPVDLYQVLYKNS